MMKDKRLRLSWIFTCLHFAILVWIGQNIWTASQWGRIVQSDGEGYYAYLPAMFIHKDIDEDYEKTVAIGMARSQGYYLDFRHKSSEGLVVNRYYCGTALCLLPFFAGGHAAAKILGDDPNGYSHPYFDAILFAAAFYSALGFYCVVRLLQRKGARDWIAIFAAAAVCWGSNMFFYTVGEPSMSHIYSFGVISAFLLALDRLVEVQSGKRLILMGVLLALLTLIRPINIIVVLLLPFFAGSWQNTFAVLKNIFSKRMVAAIIVTVALSGLILGIQLYLYYLQSGKFFVDSYGGFGFNFTSPQLFDFLFSYKKGWFVYTPLTFIAMFGLIPLFKENRFKALWLAGFILLLWWILSSWQFWWYGGSFSQRPMIDFMAIWAILLYHLITYARMRPVRIAVITLIIGTFILNQLQIYQYRYTLIHWEDMNKEKYWEAFRKIPELF